MPSLLSTHPLDRSRLLTVWESATATRVMSRAVQIWAAYMVVAVVAATIFVDHGVSAYDSLVGVPFAWASSWLWSKDGDRTTGGAVLLITFTMMIAFVAGAI